MFKGLKVVELASVLAGPDVGMFFAELGAEVFKIENKLTGGDVTRKWKSKSENQDTDISAYFSSVNYNKKYLFFNLKDETDKQKVYDLIKTADIVIANYKPGSAVKLGMDYLSLKKINPTLIYGEINGYGSDSKRAAYDVVLQAETGFMSINGELNSPPLKLPVALIDVLAAHQLKEGILIALLKKQQTGKGALVEVSLYDAAVASLKNQATNWLMGNFVPQAQGSLHPNIAPYGETFLTKDKFYVVLAIGSNKHFKQLTEILNAPELLIEKFSTNPLRVKNRADLDKTLKPYFFSLTKDEFMEKAIKLNIPAGVVNDINHVFEDEKAQKLILKENINGVNTKRIKTAVFKIS